MKVHALCLGVLGLGSLRCGSEPESDADAKARCEALEHEAARALANAASQTERACALDSDCIIQDFSARCLSGCGYPQAAAASVQSQLESERSALEERYCAPLREPRCAALIASNIPSCGPGPQDLEAICWNGKCEVCNEGFCSLQDEMQICTRVGAELRDCYSLQARN